MAAAIGLREDFDSARLRAFAKASRDANQTRRLLSLAVIYDGGTRNDAAKIGGVGLQTVRDWVLAFNTEGPDGLIDRKAPGQPALLNPSQLQALVEIVEAGPTPAIHGVVRWRLVDLGQWVFETFGVSISKQTLSDTLRRLKYRKLSARPRHHDQKPEALEEFKKTSQPAWRKLPPRRRASA